MKVIIYSGYGRLREQRWEGDLDVLPGKGDFIDLSLGFPQTLLRYKVDMINFRLDLKPPIVEITIHSL